MVIFGTLGLAVPYTPRPPGEKDSMKCVFLGGASAGGRGASGVSLGLSGLELANLWSFRLMWSTAQVAAVRFRRRLTPRERAKLLDGAPKQVHRRYGGHTSAYSLY